MGVDKAVLISDGALAESDTLVTSKVLAAAISKLPEVDLLLFGTRTADSDTGQVGPQTAALLDIPFVGSVKKVSKKKKAWEMERTMDAWEENWQAKSPAAATIHPRVYAPRPVGLVGISTVFDEPAIEHWTLADLGLKPEKVGLAGSPTRVAALEKIKRKRKCEMLEGEPPAQVEALMAYLKRKGALS